MSIDNINLGAVGELIDNLKQMPLPKVEVKPKCACCSKDLSTDLLVTINSGALGVITDDICPSCNDNLKDLCPIVCIGCKKPVARLDPGVNSSGFTIIKGRAYHIRDCPVCNPKKYEYRVVSAKLVEEEIFNQQKGK